MLAHEPGYERFCELCEDKSPGFADEDEQCAIDALLTYADTTGREMMATGQESPGFDEDETSFRVEDSDFMTMPGGEVTQAGQVAAVEPEHRAERDVTHVRAALAAMSLMHPESIAEVMLKMLGRLPMERRASIIAETMCTLDLEHIGRLAHEGLLLLRNAKDIHKPDIAALRSKIEELRNKSLAAESAYHYALDGLNLQAAE